MGLKARRYNRRARERSGSAHHRRGWRWRGRRSSKRRRREQRADYDREAKGTSDASSHALQPRNLNPEFLGTQPFPADKFSVIASLDASDDHSAKTRPKVVPNVKPDPFMKQYSVLPWPVKTPDV